MLIVLNGERTSAGASGLGSKVSSWLGPPTRNEQDAVDVLVFDGPASLGPEERGQRQAERGQDAGVEKIAAGQAVAEPHGAWGIEAEHGDLPKYQRSGRRGVGSMRGGRSRVRRVRFGVSGFEFASVACAPPAERNVNSERDDRGWPNNAVIGCGRQWVSLDVRSR